MMKKLSLIIAALAMMLGITQCKKQENPVGGKLITQEVTFTTSFGDGSKLDVTEGTGPNAGTLSLKWQIGDKITVTDDAATPNVSTLECKSVSENGLTGTFKGTITSTEGAQLKFTVGDEPKYENQHFVTISEVIYLVGESGFQQNGVYDVPMSLPYAILKLDLSALGTADGNLVTITGATENVSVKNVTNEAGKVYYVVMPLSNESKTYTFSGNGIVASLGPCKLEAHTFYTGNSETGEAFVIKPKTKPQGALSGLFSVSADKQVYFSKGNLQYVKSAGIWQFAANQYETLEDEWQNVGDDYAKQDIVGLFGWGTSGYNHNNACYQPWSTDSDAGKYYAYGYQDKGLYDVNGTADWGYNKISNGGDTEDIWRTLTTDEWCYLFAYDPDLQKFDENSPRYVLFKCGVTVCGKENCVVLLPDNWDESVISLADFAATTEYSEGTAVKWSVMDATGAVCLPITGSRVGGTVGWKSGGSYWSSSSDPNSLSACWIFFNSSRVIPKQFTTRNYGAAVRLVSEN